MVSKKKSGANNIDKGARSRKSTPNDENSGVDKQDSPGFQRTLGSMIGEIVWLMSQSPIHRKLTLADLEWLVMPPIVLGQYKLFRDESQKPIGVALWGYLNEEAEEKLKTVGKLAPQDWGNNAALDLQRGLVANDGGMPWLVELITPFHSPENKHKEQMLADLLATNFAGKQLHMLHINPETRKRESIVLGQQA